MFRAPDDATWCCGGATRRAVVALGNSFACSIQAFVSLPGVRLLLRGRIRARIDCRARNADGWPTLLSCGVDAVAVALRCAVFDLSPTLFASSARLPPPLLDAMQRGIADVLLVQHCSGGPAGTTSDQEGERPARVYEEKNDKGRPLIDADAVAFLLEKKVWKTGEEAREKLFRANKTTGWPSGPASAAWAFVVSVLEEPGTLTAVRRQPRLLNCSADTLRNNWDALLVVFDWTPEQAQRKVIQSSSLLTMSLDGTFVEKQAVLLRKGFSDEAFIMVTRFPQLLCLSSEHLEATIAWLLRQGVVKFVRVLSSQPSIFGFAKDSLEDKFAFLRLTGYDVASAITTQPVVLLLGLPRLELRFFLLLYFAG